jgi:hypothetical protein
VYALAALAYLGRVEKVAVRRVLAGLARVLLACLAMAAAVLLARWAAPAHLQVLVRLGLEIGAGVTTYLAAALLFAPVQTRDLAGLLIRLRGQQHDAQKTAIESES